MEKLTKAALVEHMVKEMGEGVTKKEAAAALDALPRDSGSDGCGQCSGSAWHWFSGSKAAPRASGPQSSDEGNYRYSFRQGPHIQGFQDSERCSERQECGVTKTMTAASRIA